MRVKREDKGEREREREGERGEVCIAARDGIVCPSGTDGEKTHTRTDWGTD
jgi:hypothetical protein